MYSRRLRSIYASLAAAKTGERLGQLLTEAKNDARGAFRRAGHSDTAAAALALKIINVCLARVEFTARRTFLHARPFGLELDPCNSCALACPGCVHSRKELFDWPKGMLGAAAANDFLRRYGPYAIHAMFYNYGEPLLNPNTPTYIRAAKRMLTQSVLSTSLSVPRFDADAYVDCGLDYMILSIDGATQPVYERYRKNGDLSRVLHNLERLVEARRRAKSRFPIIAWQFLVFEHNRHELSAAIEMAIAAGVDEMRITQPFGVEWDDPTIQPAWDFQGTSLEFNSAAPADYAANANRFLSELNGDAIDDAFASAWPIRDPGPLPAPTAGHTCQWLYMNTVLDANGRILPCCCAPAPGQNLVFGQLQPGDVFNTPHHIAARAHFASGADSPLKPYCQSCQWADAQSNPDIDPSHIGQFVQAIDPPLFRPDSLPWLSDWSIPTDFFQILAHRAPKTFFNLLS